MRNKRSIVASALLLICGAFFGDAAEPARHYSVQVWKTGSGFGQLRTGNEIVAMTQTHDGYLWLGTLHGLARFDGLQFKMFDQNNTPGLKAEGIVKLFEDSRGVLWAGTDTAGVIMIQDGKATSLNIPKAGGIDPRLRAVCEDSTGAIWLYAADGGLCRYADGNLNLWRIPSERINSTRTMVADKSGLVWVGTDSHLLGINPKGVFGTNAPPLTAGFNLTNKLDYLLASQGGGYWCLAGGHVTNRLGQDFGPYPWKQSPILCACEDREGNLVVGTFESGVYWYDAQGNAAHIGGSEGLSHSTILSLCVDREDNLWVGTDGGGLDRVKRQVFNTLADTGVMTVQSASPDAMGGLWIGFGGAGVKYWNAGTLKSYEPGADWYIQSVFVDRDQGVWAWGRKLSDPAAFLFQFNDGGFRRVLQTGDVVRGGAALYQDHQGLLWAGTQSGLACWNGHDWKFYTTREGLSSDAVRAIAGDSQGNLWIGTDHGLNLFRDGKFTAFHELSGLPSEDISSLYVDSVDVLWIGSRGKGLARYSNGHWTHYSTANGLTSNSIGYLIEDDQGFLWIGSPAGLMRIRKQALNDVANGLAKEVSCRTFEEPDGLRTGECTMGSQPGACRTLDGRLWFPTIQGLAYVDPKEILFNTNPPPVLIESILVDEQPQNTNGLGGRLPLRVVVPADKESLDIRYTSLNLATADKARFRYQLLGFEAKPTEVDSNTRDAHYNKLPAGDYQFRVTACNEDGVWNLTNATLAITVLPPFWRKPGFILVMAICALGLIIGVVHYFSTQRLQRQLEGFRQQQALERERSRIARDIHDQLGASLTQVSLLGEMVESDKNVPEEVEAHARQISQTARDTSRVLDEIVWTVNPSNDTLDGLVNYVCKYAQEYLAVAGVRYRLDVPSDLPATEISPEVRHNVFLAAKECVTNVVRHAKATEVWLRLKLEPDKFILEIQDNGGGLVNLESKKSRNGLRNLHKRMEDVGGTFSLTSPPEGGALARLTVPLGNHS